MSLSPDELRKLRLERQRGIIHHEFVYAKAVSRGELVYPNQKEASNACIRHFNEGKSVVNLVSQPGTGKTGTILDFMINIATHPDDERCVEVKDINLMSGMSDIQWRDQTQSKMLPHFRDRVYHRGELKKRQHDISDLQNAVIINDEVHVASGKAMSISKSLIAAGLNDVSVLENKRIKMLDISATPEAISQDMKAWGNKSAVVKLLPGPLYKGFEVMLDEDRIHQASSFANYEDVRQWFQLFVTRYQDTTKKFFPMRVQKVETLGFIRRAIVEFGWCEIKHDADDKKQRVDNIDQIMETAPDKHTIILIKNFWRASKRIVRTHVGGSYEAVPKKQNNTSAAQGLIGRFCDNYEYVGDELNNDLRPLHFGDKASIETYVNWFNHDCNYTDADYRSNRISAKNGFVKSKSSSRHKSIMRNLPAVNVENIDHDNIHKRIPVVFDEFPVEIFAQLATGDKKAFIKQFIEDNLPADDNPEFIEIISNTSCFQQSTPVTASSRKKNIEATVNAMTKNKPLGIKDAGDTEVNDQSCWQAFIDNVDNKLCILWQKR